MTTTLSYCTEQHRDEAVAELRTELREFNHDGLVQLLEDLVAGAVVRGSWAGCVISYRRGGAGSSRRDRLGRARNSFTILWDNGRITDEEVSAAVEDELERRRVPSPAETRPNLSRPGRGTLVPTARRA